MVGDDEPRQEVVTGGSRLSDVVGNDTPWLKVAKGGWGLLDGWR